MLGYFFCFFRLQIFKRGKQLLAYVLRSREKQTHFCKGVLWCIEKTTYSNWCADALRAMQQLTHLILPTFCTNNILNALARTCKVSFCLQITFFFS
jgi:hypothetical protein